MLISLNKQVSMDDIIDIICEKLETGGKVTFTPNGTSMLPMLRDGEDVVVLEKPKGRLHLFDVPLYKRENGTYVMHRVVNYDRDGSYVMCGDNQFAYEHGIQDSQIIGVMTAFYRKGKPYSVDSLAYRFYVNLWFYIKPFRRVYKFTARKTNQLFGKGNKAQNEERPD
jgi:hypothetical protein